MDRGDRGHWSRVVDAGSRIGKASVRIQNLQTRELRALEGVKILEVSRHLAGAYCGKLLADYGAEVVRAGGPELDSAIASEHAEALRGFLDAKKSTLDLSDAAAVRRAADHCELVLMDEDADAYSYAVLDHAVLHEDLKRVRVVMRGHGSVTAENSWRGCSLTMSAASGASWAIGRPGREPLMLPYDLPEIQLGINAAGAAIAGLLLKRTSGRGVSVSVAGTDVLAYYVGVNTTVYCPYERSWSRDGARASGSAGVYPYAIMRCRDGLVCFACRSGAHWEALVRAMGNPEWAQEARFQDPVEIARHHSEEADRYLTPWVESRSRAELLELGQTHGFPVAPVRTVREAIAEPQLLARDFLLTQETANKGHVKMPGVPYRVRSSGNVPKRSVAGSQASRASSAPHHGLETETRDVVSWPLSGLRVVDLSWVWAGPTVGATLADLGATVIKVESRTHPDISRTRGRPLYHGKPLEGPALELTPYFHQVNRGKRGMTVDLSKSAGAELIRRLVDVSDVVIENMRPGVLERRGLDYSVLAARNPRLIMLSMTAAGHDGPLKNLMGFAPVVSAMAGLEGLIGYADDNDVTGMLTFAFADPNSGALALATLLAALYQQQEHGIGTWIDFSQLEGMLSVLPEMILESALENKQPSLPGNGHRHYTLHGTFPCAGTDRWIAVAVMTDHQWRLLVKYAKDASFARVSVFASASGRLQNRDRLHDAFSAWTKTHDRDTLACDLQEREIPASAVLSYEESVLSGRLKQRGLVQPVEHRFSGTEDIYVTPWSFDGVFPTIGKPAPLLGEDNSLVLRETLGMSDEEINELMDTGVLN